MTTQHQPSNTDDTVSQKSILDVPGMILDDIHAGPLAARSMSCAFALIYVISIFNISRRGALKSLVSFVRIFTMIPIAHNIFVFAKLCIGILLGESEAMRIANLYYGKEYPIILIWNVLIEIMSSISVMCLIGSYKRDFPWKDTFFSLTQVAVFQNVIVILGLIIATESLEHIMFIGLLSSIGSLLALLYCMLMYTTIMIFDEYATY